MKNSSLKSSKKLLSAVLALIFSLSVLAFIPAKASTTYEAYFLDGTIAKEATFILDPGHGGEETGALAEADENGIQRREADDNLNMAIKVATYLESKGETVALTRITDKTVALIDRSHISNNGNYQIFCSLHRNFADNKAARGIETYYFNGLTADSNSAKIAEVVHRHAMAVSSETNDRFVRNANFSVLRETFTNAILIESLFMSNAQDNILYDKIESDLATAIANGLIESKQYAIPDYVLDDTYYPVDLGDSFVASITLQYCDLALTNDGNNNVCATTIDNSTAQLWKFEKLDSRNAYKITSLLDNKCLDIDSFGTADCTNVMVWDDNGSNCQKYYFYSIYEKNVIRPMHCTNDKVLDVNAINHNTQIYDLTLTNPNQQFTIVKVEIEGEDESSNESENTSKLELIENSTYSLENNVVSKVFSNTTAESFVSNFTNEVSITTANGEIVEASEKIGTGYIVTDIASGESADILVLGDVNGDGELSATDYIQIKSFFLSGQGLDGIYATAANIDGEGSIEGTDYIKLKSHFLGQSNIYA